MIDHSEPQSFIITKLMDKIQNAKIKRGHVKSAVPKWIFGDNLIEKLTAEIAHQYGVI